MLRRFASIKLIGLILITASVPALFSDWTILNGTAAAQPERSLDYQYPILQEKDFELFFNLMKYIEKGETAEQFFDDFKVTRTYSEDVLTKITVNTLAKIGDNADELALEYGKGVFFTPAEKKIFDKYEDQIVKTMVGLAEKK
ncbi:MAG: hypothetical protein LBR53_12650 [Deltaproteobacteria bacterium]|jgi:hypothetical protein|nr:hypothetical protein [Deltaproteobacteria bacterium]